MTLLCKNCGCDDLKVEYSLEPHEICVSCTNCGCGTVIATIPYDIDPYCTKIKPVNQNIRKLGRL